MEILDLTDDRVAAYLCCLEEWSDEMDEAGDHKARWYELMKDRGLCVKVAVEGDDAVGMIQYLPIEESFADGRGLSMIMCIWVHGHDQGVGDRQGRGIGTALLHAAEADAEARGATGMAAWGVQMPFWMRSAWFKKHGYRSADSRRGSELVWKPFTPDAEPPKWIPQGPPPAPVADQVTIDAYISGWCPSMNIVYERARRAAEAVGPPVVFRSFDVSEHQEMVRQGHSDVVFLDGKELQRGAPPSYDSIERKVKKKVRKLERR